MLLDAYNRTAQARKDHFQREHDACSTTKQESPKNDPEPALVIDAVNDEVTLEDIAKALEAYHTLQLEPDGCLTAQNSTPEPVNA